MKYTTIIGILLIAIAIVASFVGKIQFGDLLTEPEFVLGLLYGGGAGLIIGGVIGWMYKKCSKDEIVRSKSSENTIPPSETGNL